MSTPAQPHPAVRLHSDRPVSGLISGFPAKSPSHAVAQWLCDLAFESTGFVLASRFTQLPLRGQYRNR